MHEDFPISAAYAADQCREVFLSFLLPFAGSVVGQSSCLLSSLSCFFTAFFRSISSCNLAETSFLLFVFFMDFVRRLLHRTCFEIYCIHSCSPLNRGCITLKIAKAIWKSYMNAIMSSIRLNGFKRPESRSPRVAWKKLKEKKWKQSSHLLCTIFTYTL